MLFDARNLNLEVTAHPNECRLILQKAFSQHIGPCNPYKRHFELDALVVCHYGRPFEDALVSLGVRRERCADDPVLSDRPDKISVLALPVPLLNCHFVLEQGTPV